MMQEAPQLREQLRSLSIPRDQRPGRSVRRGGSRTAASFLLLALLALGGYAVFQRYGDRLAALRTPAAAEPAPPTSVPAVASAPAGPAAVLTATGKIVSDHEVEVATKVSGQIVALYFEQGDAVQQGQIIAAIEDAIPRARRDEAQANLDRARAQLEFQRTNFARIEGLHQARQASDIEYADARRALAEADALVGAGEAALALAEKVLRDCEVAAPIAGVVLERNVEVGDFVAAEAGRGALANAMFATIADMKKLRVEVDVSELDVNRLRPGMPCIITPDAYKERRYHGRVLWLDPGANYAKATVQAKVRIEDPDEFLRVEGAAQVQFMPLEVASAPAPEADAAPVDAN